MAPPGRETRPTSDRVREAVFNALVSLGVLDDARVLDLFAGTGAMGIEALSRGAGSATLVDNSRKAVSAIRANLATTGLVGQATVVQIDAASYLRSVTEPFDIVFVDPPYSFTDWADLLTGIARIAPGATVVIESDRSVEVDDRWSVIRERRYGSTLVTLAETPTGPRGPC